ncbi:hypothetical protein [Rhodopseudomonas telluris]|uniref:Uncharacterized protein n=1 Tax=Rhodopseudomonas telluris TaxID=644215 RepID=A0ABV6F075_9BRAD
MKSIRRSSFSKLLADKVAGTVSPPPGHRKAFALPSAAPQARAAIDPGGMPVAPARSRIDFRP